MGNGIAFAHDNGRVVACALGHKRVDALDGMADRTVLRQRLRREVSMLPAVVKQRCERARTEPKHTAVGRNGRFFTRDGHIQPQILHQLLRIFKVRAPAAGAHIHKIQSVGRVRRAKDTEVRVLLKLAQNIQHMRRIFADILIADIAEPCTHAAGLCLDGFFIMHKAGVVIFPQLRGQITEEGRHIAALILHHGHGNAVYRQAGKGCLDLRLFIGTARCDKDIGLRREFGSKSPALVEHIHKIQMHGQRDAAVLAKALCRIGILHGRFNDAGQRQIPCEVVGVHRPDHILPDQLQRVVRLIAQIVIQLLHRLACGIVEVGLQLMHKAAALEKRAFFFAQQQRRADQQRVVGKLLQVIGLDIDIPLKALIPELLGEHSLIPLHRVGVAFDHRHRIPIGLQFRVLHKALAIDNEMGLDMHRQIVVKMLALEGV